MATLPVRRFPADDMVPDPDECACAAFIVLDRTNRENMRFMPQCESDCKTMRINRISCGNNCELHEYSE